jgi:hypothetical protein
MRVLLAAAVSVGVTAMLRPSILRNLFRYAYSYGAHTYLPLTSSSELVLPLFLSSWSSASWPPFLRNTR